jgi:abequosyltransferase
MTDILLSLCIPTFNRCDILDGTLAAIFSNPDFKPNLIEVIVSDNCSTDKTSVVVSKYSLVRYYRNETNIHDYNFEVALGYARGKYIRIVNDTFRFKANVLSQILLKVQNCLDSGVNLFFYPNFRSNCYTRKDIHGIEDLFMNCSFYTTWSASTGFWKVDFENVKKGNRYTELQFPQLHWMYNIVRNGKKTIIYFLDMYDVQLPNKKIGYNFFKTFVSGYLDIVKDQNLPIFHFEFEKFRLFKYHILPWIDVMYSQKEQVFGFEKSGAFSIMFKRYWYAPYFYPLLLGVTIKIFFKKFFY